MLTLSSASKRFVESNPDILAAAPTPEPLGRLHRPLPHRRVRDAIGRALGDRVQAERLYMSRDGLTAFGVLSLGDDTSAPVEMTRDLLWRHSNDQSEALRITFGRTVTMCKNGLLMETDNREATRHTARLEADLPHVVQAMLARLMQADQSRAIPTLRAATACPVHETEGYAWLAQQFRDGLLSGPAAREALRRWHRPEDYTRRDAFGLFGAYNAAAKRLALGPQMHALERGWRNLCLEFELN